MKRFVIIFLSLLFFGCKTEIDRIPEPDNLIPKDMMVMVMKEIMILESYVRQKYPLAAQNHKLVQKSADLIFSKYHMDSIRFNDAMDYYGSRQKEMLAINSQILDSINRELTELSAK